MSTKSIVILSVIALLLLLIPFLRTALIGVVSKFLGPTFTASSLLSLKWLYAIIKWIWNAHMVILKNLVTPKKLIYRDLEEELREKK